MLPPTMPAWRRASGNTARIKRRLKAQGSAVGARDCGLGTRDSRLGTPDSGLTPTPDPDAARAIGRAGVGTTSDDGGGALLVNPAAMFSPPSCACTLTGCSAKVFPDPPIRALAPSPTPAVASAEPPT